MQRQPDFQELNQSFYIIIIVYEMFYGTKLAIIRSPTSDHVLY